ncbi:hypothetical protein Tco_1016771 [Tanacetum coccineum]|uniref:CCHC-type domain-containing protein n=1 Tax=Tanacetum coccineum TaxID=301880 RepID=A0ABQ5FPL3_9ASTR
MIAWATLYGAIYNYEEGLMDSIYDDSDVEEDTRSSSEFLADLNVEGKSKKRLFTESFNLDEDEGVTKVKAFMAITEDEPSVGKADARSDYTHVYLHYVEDQRKNLLSKFNSLNQELSSCKSELCDLKNTKALNYSLQKEIARFNLENESLKYEISDLKKEEKKRKDAISPKEVMFTKADDLRLPLRSPLTLSLSVIIKILCLLFLNSQGLSLSKKTQTKSLSVLDPCPDRKADSSTKQLLLTLMEEVKGLKEQIKPPSDKSASISQIHSSKSAKGKQKTWYGPCKNCRYRNHLYRNHLPKDCYIKPKCSTCGSSKHLTKEHPEQVVVKKTLAKLKAHSS